MLTGRKIPIIVLVIMCLVSLESICQKPAINFHHLTVKQGLNDGMINAICQDSYGFMWFASFGGLNRFDGVSVQKFSHIPGDSNSVKNGVPYCMTVGNDNKLWIGYTDGLMSFDIVTRKAKQVAAFKGDGIYSINRTGNDKLYMSVNDRLVCYDPAQNKVEQVYIDGDTATENLVSKRKIFDFTIKNDKIFIGSTGGFVIYDIISKKARFVALPQLHYGVNRVMQDSEGYFWISSYNNYSLWRVAPDLSTIDTFDTLLSPGSTKLLATALDFREDKKGRVWIITNSNGLLEYNIKTRDVTIHKHDISLPATVSGDLLRTMHVNEDGTLWVSGTAGLDYCNPDKNLFTIIYPLPGKDDSKYARGVTEDHKGNFWFTTADGISQYNPVTRTYKVWQNEYGRDKKIYYNSARAIVEDNEHRIWMVTGQGVNRFDPATGNMEFLTMQDSLPPSFYFSANKLNDGTIWFGTRDYDGYYFYSPADKKIRSISSHPVLKKFIAKGGRYVLEDSKKRLWLGSNGFGVVMYDPSNNTLRAFHSADENQNKSIAGDLIVDIKEDKNGVVWISSFGGVSGIDITNNKVYNFNDQNGLKSNIVGPIAIDAWNRLWIGTAAGLSLLDSSRQTFTHFGEESGLPSAEFPEHPGFYASNGDIIFPTVKGYVRFDPLRYKEATAQIRYYVSEFRVFDEPVSLDGKDPIESKISLRPDKNFFSISLVGLNYENPSQTWFAYQLEGFDKEWHFTRDPKAVYTNVPGGDYTFRYKATANPNNWNIVEKTISIHIGTVFYKAAWFWILIGIAVLSFLYWFYRNRIRHQKQLLLLQSKAQLLEKEKALVMYESLKQQLNPHFLFNSLTSLNSLINSDPKIASDFLDSLSKTYRYILKSRDNETVTLSDEIRFAESYVKLQLTRFEKGFCVHFDIGEEFGHRKIVPVTLQNLIENAIKHNIIDEDRPLKVQIFVENDDLIVKNNTQKKNFVETSNKQGLANLRSLYRYLSNRPVEIMESNNFFTVKIPLL